MTILSIICAFSACQVGNASVFAYHGDEHAGGVAPYLGRHVRPTDAGIAHRTLPLGTRVRVVSVRTGRSVVARVVDRGPYGACLDEGYSPLRDGVTCDDWYVKKRWYWPGKWRAVADLTPAVARRIGHRGFEPVVLYEVGE